jgi:hypothetical protein
LPSDACHHPSPCDTLLMALSPLYAPLSGGLTAHRNQIKPAALKAGTVDRWPWR